MDYKEMNTLNNTDTTTEKLKKEQIKFHSDLKNMLKEQEHKRLRAEQADAFEKMLKDLAK